MDDRKVHLFIPGGDMGVKRLPPDQAKTSKQAALSFDLMGMVAVNTDRPNVVSIQRLRPGSQRPSVLLKRRKLRVRLTCGSCSPRSRMISKLLTLQLMAEQPVVGRRCALRTDRDCPYGSATAAQQRKLPDPIRLRGCTSITLRPS